MSQFAHVVAEVRARGLRLHYDAMHRWYTITEGGTVIWSGNLDDVLAFLSEWDDLMDGGFDD